MRRILYDSTGAPRLYLTGAGVLYTLANAPTALVLDEQVVARSGLTVAWFDGAFMWGASGVLAFVKGAAPQGGLELPRTQPLRLKPQPTPAPFHPLLLPQEKPPLRWVWSPQPLMDVLQGSATV